MMVWVLGDRIDFQGAGGVKDASRQTYEGISVRVFGRQEMSGNSEMMPTTHTRTGQPNVRKNEKLCTNTLPILM